MLFDAVCCALNINKFYVARGTIIPNFVKLTENINPIK